MTQINLGTLRRNEERFHVQEALMDIVHIFDSQTKSKNIEMRIKFNSYMPDYLISDKQRMQQVLRTYLSNAVKFTLPGGIVRVIANYSKHLEEIKI